jgi:hypothetical protein
MILFDQLKKSTIPFGQLFRKGHSLKTGFVGDINASYGLHRCDDVRKLFPRRTPLNTIAG